jgi:DMSO/TMAO reductase YedYZ molybdopterin-dependent catalytic subunit
VPNFLPVLDPGAVVRSRDATAGVLAVGVAIGVAELVAALQLRVPSPLDAVGQVLIPRFPSPVTSWAIATFGSANRVALLVGTLLVASGIGALLGVVARERWPLAVVGFASAGAGGAMAAGAQAGASADASWITAAVAVVAGLATLRSLLSRSVAVPATPPPAPPAAGRGTPAVPLHGRRAFVVAAAGAGAAAIVTLAVGRYALGGRVGLVDPARVVLPSPVRALPSATPAQELSGPAGLSPLFTPTDGFFRIDTALRVPQVDPDTWELRIHGLVDREIVITYAELLAMPLEEVDITLLCVSNEVGGDLVGNARWTGIRLADLLERAGVAGGAGQVVGRSVDGFEAGFPLEAVSDGRAAIVAVAMNGEPLPTRHGFPARLVVPGLYGYVSATKWLAEIELTTWEGFDGYWVPRGWSKEGPVKTASRIDVPQAGARLDPGPTVVAGVAWAPTRGVGKVQVQVDDGPWIDAELSSPLSADTWVQWRTEVELPAGTPALRVRAVDGEGGEQPPGPRPPAPDGAEGWHQVDVRTA